MLLVTDPRFYVATLYSDPSRVVTDPRFRETRKSPCERLFGSLGHLVSYGHHCIA